MNIENAKTWSAALRSDEYPQCRNTLTDGDGFCCLGVAYKVLIGPIKDNINHIDSQYIDVIKVLGFDKLKDLNHFVIMNDKQKASFVEIADYIDKLIVTQEANPV